MRRRAQRKQPSEHTRSIYWAYEAHPHYYISTDDEYKIHIQIRRCQHTLGNYSEPEKNCEEEEEVDVGVESGDNVLGAVRGSGGGDIGGLQQMLKALSCRWNSWCVQLSSHAAVRPQTKWKSCMPWRRERERETECGWETERTQWAQCVLMPSALQA